MATNYCYTISTNTNNYTNGYDSYTLDDLVFRPNGMETKIAATFKCVYDKFIIERSDQGYPKYNILKTDDGFKIEVALAGYQKDDIDVIIEDRYLVIKYDKEQTDDKEYIYKGIATRKFKLIFELNDIDRQNIKAKFDNGLLTIDLKFDKEFIHQKIKIN